MELAVKRTNGPQSPSGAMLPLDDPLGETLQLVGPAATAAAEHQEQRLGGSTLSPALKHFLAGALFVCVLQRREHKAPLLGRTLPTPFPSFSRPRKIPLHLNRSRCKLINGKYALWKVSV